MLLAASAEWLTGFWLLSVGVSLGLIVVAILVSLLWLGSKMGLARVADSSQSFVIAGGIASALFLALGTAVWITFGFETVLVEGIPQVESNPLLTFLLLIPVALFLGFGTVGMLSTRAAEQMGEWLTEGVSFWMLMIGGGLAIFAIIGSVGQYAPPIRFVMKPNALIKSAMRLPFTGVAPTREIELQPSPDGYEGDPVSVNFNGSELKKLSLQSDQRLEIATAPITLDFDRKRIYELGSSSEPTTETPGKENTRFPQEFIENFYVRNLGDTPAKFLLTVETQPEFPQVAAVYWAILGTVGGFVLILFQTVLFPKESAISWATFKTETSQPLFAILLAIGMVFLAAAVYIPYNTFGEDIKMYVTTGHPVILLLSIFFAVWASSKSVAEEIDGRTALTVLAKPISRRQFLIGKAFGIGWAVAILFLCLGLWFLFLVSYKPIYDGVEASKGALPWQDGFGEMAKVVPALLLAYMETMVFVFISVMISTRLPIVSNLMICFAIYVMGHITPLLLETEDSFQGVAVVGQTISTVIPVLDHFSVQAAIVGDAGVPLVYLGWTLVYTILYCSVALFIALILFEDRDLS